MLYIYHLAKVKVEGSNPFARSKRKALLNGLIKLFTGSFFCLF